MFVGHFGVGFAAERIAPQVSLGSLFLAVEFADGLWPLLLLAGIEHVRIVPGLMKASALDLYDYPWSHSLLALCVWSALAGAVYCAARRSRWGAWILAALVISHWLLDVWAHRPDMPLFPHGPYLGFGLWNSIPATLAIEGLLYLGGLALYLRSTEPADRVGSRALGSLVILLFGPPPPDERTLAISGLFGWLFIPWGYWIDRHRAPRVAERT
jgi:membrane-bound metal-dependent hydrolase YbcI (DUF457 family)